MNYNTAPDPRIPQRTIVAYSSFGAAGTTFPNVPAAHLLNGPRYQALEFRESFYKCTQHDDKHYSFDGMLIDAASGRPLTSEAPPFRVPLSMRRPSVPMRLGRVIVNAFTQLIFGENRFPQIRVNGDETTQDFYRAISRHGKLPVKMIELRTLGGSMGTAGLSWCYRDGLPSFDVHNAKNLLVHSWADRARCIPANVSEVYPVVKSQWNGKEMQQIYYWHRRDWTQEGEITCRDVLVDKNPTAEIPWEVEKFIPHDTGDCHFAWIQNTPESETIDGRPDYDGCYDQMDTIDILNSVTMKGAILNLDPTLVIIGDTDYMSKVGIKKGSDDAITPGEEGDAKYLELAGTSITAGIALKEDQRKSILETAMCVIPYADHVAAQGASSVAMKMMYAPMTACADLRREQYADAISRALESQRKSAIAETRTTVSVVTQLEDGTKTEEDAEIVLNLPPRQVSEVDPESGEETITEVPRDPGEGGELNLMWPPYFPPTPADQAQIVTTLSTATGMKAFLSTETATDLAASALGFDPADEKKRMSAQTDLEAQQQADQLAAMNPPMTDPSDPNAKDEEQPPGGKPPGNKLPPPPKGGGFPPKKLGGFGKPPGGKPAFGGGGKPGGFKRFGK